MDLFHLNIICLFWSVGKEGGMPGLDVSDRMEKFELSPDTPANTANSYKVAPQNDSNK